jgi:hypothetical protein
VLGVTESKNDGHHDDIWVTAMMMVTDPRSVRYHERVEANLASINGIDIAPMEDAIELEDGHVSRGIHRKRYSRRDR